MQASSLTCARSPINITLSPITKEIEANYKREKTNSKRRSRSKTIRKDIRFTSRSYKKAEEIAKSHGIPVAHFIRETFDGLLCGDFKKR